MPKEKTEAVQRKQQRSEEAEDMLKAHGFQTKLSNPVVVFSRKKIKVNPKVELMKIKMKATGTKSIPVDSRLYLRLWVSNDKTGVRSLPIFIHCVMTAVEIP